MIKCGSEQQKVLIYNHVVTLHLQPFTDLTLFFFFFFCSVRYGWGFIQVF